VLCKFLNRWYFIYKVCISSENMRLHIDLHVYEISLMGFFIITGLQNKDGVVGSHCVKKHSTAFTGQQLRSVVSYMLSSGRTSESPNPPPPSWISICWDSDKQIFLAGIVNICFKGC